MRSFGTVFTAVGVLIFLIMMAIAVPLSVGERDRDAHWTRTMGSVVAIESKHGDDGLVYRPVVGFEADGAYTCVTNHWSGGRPTVGDEREVLYDPAAPARCELPDSRWVKWLLSGLGTFFLVLFGGIGLVIRRSEWAESHERR